MRSGDCILLGLKIEVSDSRQRGNVWTSLSSCFFSPVH